MLTMSFLYLCHIYVISRLETSKIVMLKSKNNFNVDQPDQTLNFQVNLVAFSNSTLKLK